MKFMLVKPADLTILRYPAPSLRVRAVAIARIDDQVRTVAQRMIDLMHEAEGVGLAAPQVGLSWRLFVTDVPEDGGPKVYINPRLTQPSKQAESAEEGCLSLPGVRVEVSRPSAITVTALDLEGSEFSATSDALPARVWQHEFDHLNGVLIIDRLGADERHAMRQSLKMKSAIGGL